MSGLKNLIHQVHRRSLWQVLGIYVVGGWLVLQVVDTLAGALNLPDWAPRFALFLLIIGLPIVLATAFVQEGLRDLGDSAGEPEETSGGTPIPGTGEGAQTAGIRLFTWRHAIIGGVLAFAAWGVVSAGSALFGGLAGESGDSDAVIESIAVLPFADMSPDGDQEYFSDGMAETLLDALARIPGLRVPARTSSFQFKGESADVREVAEKLNVAAVLEGSVRTDGDRVRVTAQLVDAEEGFHIWSATYDRRMTGIFELQDEIAHSIVEALRIRLPGGTEAVLVSEPTENLDAYALFLRGRHTWHERTLESLETAIQYFEQAVELDSSYALAWAGLADTYVLMAEWEYLPPQEAYRVAEQAAARALALDDDLAAAHAAYGALLHSRAEDSQDLAVFAEAEREYRRAVELNPNYASAHQWYGELITDLGRLEEARPEIERAIELDPLSPVVRTQLVFIHMDQLDFAEAYEVASRVVELNPESALGYNNQSYALSMSGKGERALALARKARDLNPDAPLFRYGPMWALLAMRDWEGAEAEAYALIEAGIGTHEAHYTLFQVRIERGRYDEARSELEQANELRREQDGPFTALDDAYLAARAGETERARALLAELERLEGHQRWNINLGWIGGVYGWLGDADTAFDYLERAAAANSQSLIPLLVDNWYDPLREDPRFEELTSRIKRAE